MEEGAILNSMISQVITSYTEKVIQAQSWAGNPQNRISSYSTMTIIIWLIIEFWEGLILSCVTINYDFPDYKGN